MSHFRNRLLLKLAGSDLDILAPDLEAIDLRNKTILISPHARIEHVYFPETCVLSVLAQAESVSPIEVGMIGFEGMSDQPLRYGDTSPMRCVVQVPGMAHRLPARLFAKHLQDLPSLVDVTLRYKETLTIQFAFTALSHGSFTIEQRLARWLLMSHDRGQRETIPLVHEFMAAMLAVRRAGVTRAVHDLEGAGAIRASRGTITIRDRDKLISIAAGSYGVPEGEYERVMAR